MWTMNFQMFKLAFWKAVEPEINLQTSSGSSKKAKEFQEKIYIYIFFIDYTKAFDCVDHNKLWKILKENGISDHLTCLFRNLYAGQAATVRTGHGTTDGFQIVKGVHQGCIFLLSYSFICSVHHEKCQADWSTNGNEDCREKYQSLQICRWHHCKEN